MFWINRILHSYKPTDFLNYMSAFQPWLEGEMVHPKLATDCAYFSLQSKCYIIFWPSAPFLQWQIVERVTGIYNRYTCTVYNGYTFLLGQRV